jgi:hypothetical protein
MTRRTDKWASIEIKMAKCYDQDQELVHLQELMDDDLSSNSLVDV